MPDLVRPAREKERQSDIGTVGENVDLQNETMPQNSTKPKNSTK
jgi:hypothetical protein